MRETQTVEFKVLSCYSYFLTYGEDDNLTEKEVLEINLFLAFDVDEAAPEGFSFGHTSVEPENWSGDYGRCEITGSHGELVTLTAMYFKNE